MEFEAATCPSCGGDLQIPLDKESVKCMYCGRTIVVRDAIKARVDVLLKLADAAFDAKNFKEAYDCVR